MFTDLTYFCCYWNDAGVFKLRIFQSLPQPFFHLKYKKKTHNSYIYALFKLQNPCSKHPNLRMSLKSVSRVARDFSNSNFRRI